MKNSKYILLIVLLLTIGIFVIAKTPKEPPKEIVIGQKQTQEKPKVTVIIDDSSAIATYSAVTGSTAYEALVNAAARELFTLKTKQYDFGVFIEQIGESPNTNDKAWIYYINEKSATAAADKQEVREGDRVKWKYEKPLY